MTSDTDPELMGLAPAPALTYPTDLNHLHLVSDVSVLDDMAQAGVSRQVVEKYREVRLARPPVHRNSPHAFQATPYEAEIPPPLPRTRSPMPIRPHSCWCSLDSPAPAPRVERSGNSHKRLGLNPRRVGSVDALSTSSDGSQSTGSSTSYQTASDNTKIESDPVEVSKPQLRRSPSKNLLNFCRSLFHHDSNHAYALFLRAYPEYKLTRPIDTLREREYKRLRRSDEVYVDYMGASLYPECLIHSNSAFLRRTVLGNTHSISARSASEI